MGYEWVAIALFFGILTGIAGRMKGGSFLLWLVIGTVLPGFGLLAALLQRNEATEPERTCTGCGARVKLYVQICPRCGEELYLPDPGDVSMPRPKPSRFLPTEE
jgi:predicted RNA-binding Zn-ribbon protein involved in translation (DUF1610 family)